MYYMGIDVGTSGCKAAIIDCHGVVCAKSSRTYTLLSPQVGWLELNPATLLEQVKQCILELYPFTKDVTGIATCSIGESMVILDEHDAPVTNCISYLDRRLTATEDAFTRSIAPDQLYDVTYLPVSEMYSARQLLWYQQNQPEVLARAKQILPVCNYIDYVLTGEAAIDYTQASRTMLFDARTHSWSEEFARILGINLRLFPKPSRCGTLVGKIRPKVAAELGLNPNASVYLGGHDQPISTLGSGAFKRGEIMMGQGSTESMNYLLTPSSNDLELFKKDRVCLEPFIDEELFIVTLGQLCYGTSIRWFARAMEQDLLQRSQAEGFNIYARLDELCAPETNVIFLPYLSPVNFQISQAVGSFIGFHSENSRAELYRALLEGLCLESRRVKQILNDRNCRFDSVVANGGCTKSDLLMQIKADIMDCNIVTLEGREAGIMGLALLSAVSSGGYKDYAEASANMVHVRQVYTPRNNSQYEEKYQKYLRLRDAVLDVYAI